MNNETSYLTSIAPYVFDYVGELSLPDEFTNGQILLRKATTINDEESERMVRLKARRLTNLSAMGTVYGREHKLQFGSRVHSPSGLNVEMILANGQYSEEELTKLIRSMVVADDARAVRTNQIVNAFQRSDKYENYTRLLFSLLSMYYTQLAYEKTTKTQKRYKITKTFIDGLKFDFDEDELACDYIVRKFLNSIGMKITQPGYIVNGSIMNWLQMDSKTEEIDVVLDFWVINKYDDGHTVIDNERGKVFGFNNRSYVVVNPNIRVPFYEGINYHGQSFINVSGEASLDAYANQRYKLRLDGLTTNQVSILLTAIKGFDRITPFLSDQRIMSIDIGQVHFYGPNGKISDFYRFETFDRQQITSDTIKDTIRKFVNTHRCYDDMLVAMRSFMPYIAQPDADTVEAHTWWDREYSTVLPEFGAFRGLHVQFISGVPAQLTKDAMDVWNAISHSWQYITVAGFVHNTLWQWGEYMRFMNLSDGLEQLSAVHRPGEVSRPRESWIPGIISGVTGKAMPANIFLDCGTIYKDDPSDMFVGKVVNIDSTTETDLQRKSWGWSTRTLTSGLALTLNQPAAPSGIVLVIGSAGSLLSGTPLCPKFLVTKPEVDYGITRTLIRSSWFNTWAMGVVTRFHGYDLKYTVGSDSKYANTRDMWAANNVQIVTPPVLDMDTADYSRYRWLGTVDRDVTFAENPMDKMSPGEQRSFVWKNMKAVVMRKADIKSLPAAQFSSTAMTVTKAYTAFVTDLNYVQSVLSSYDPTTQGFQLALTRLGQLPQQAHLPEPGLAVPAIEQGDLLDTYNE
jgi:hypothetical protein